MQHRLRLLMGATALLYLGPLLAGMAGFGWNLVPVFAAIFVLWLMILHPQSWPRNLDGWTNSQAWVTLGTQGAVQLLLVAMLFGVGRGVGGALSVLAPFPVALPILVSAISIPMARLIWDPWQDTDTEQFLDRAVSGVAHADDAAERNDLAMARRLIAPLAGMPDDSTPEDVARHLVALSGHAEDRHVRAALLERQHSGKASRAETLALILHATDGPLCRSIGDDGPNLALALLPHGPDFIGLFARRLAAAVDADGEIWSQCPAPEHLADLLKELAETDADAPLRELLEALERARPENRWA